MEADILYTVFKFYDIKSVRIRDIKLDRIKNSVITDHNEILSFFLQLSLDTFNASEFDYTQPIVGKVKVGLTLFAFHVFDEHINSQTGQGHREQIHYRKYDNWFRER